MVKITEALIRKRAEHNEGEIFSLEEISLHQQDIEKIEHLDKWCRELKILYLQSNLISKIENVGRLKKLEYINLAINNIERIENLEGCESLKKLDLTVNFVGELTSIESLRGNIHLVEIFLTGNPCTEYEGYRDYVVATLLQLKWLDGTEITRTERIQAQQNYESVREKIIEHQKEYSKKREKEKQEHDEKKMKKDEETESQASKKPNESSDDNEEKEGETGEEEEVNDVDKKFWDEATSYTPESRVEVHEYMKKKKEKEDKKTEKPIRQRKMFGEDGRPFNINEAKLDFKLDDDDHGNIVLDLAVYKYLSTAMIDVDVQPHYVRVSFKGKVFQLALLEEVCPDSSDAKRSQTTGHLVITMPKANPRIPLRASQKMNKKEELKNESTKDPREPQYLEVGHGVPKNVDLRNIVSESKKDASAAKQSAIAKKEPENSPDFVDDPDVPPLM